MLTELSALLDMLKAKGVAHARLEPMTLPSPWGVIDVTFAPAIAPLDDSKPTKQVDADMCRCGHSLTEHTNGLCLHACEAEKCGEP